MRVPWSQVPLKAKKAISKGISRSGPGMSAPSAVNTVQGLSKLGVRWEELLPVLREDLCRLLARTLPTMNEQEVSTSISALGRLAACWSSLPEELREAVLSAFLRVEPSMGSRGAAMSLLGLAKTDADASLLPAEFHIAIVRVLEQSLRVANAQEVANIFYALGRMGFRAADLPKTTLAALLAALQLEVSRMCGAGVSQALLGLVRMQVKLAQISSVTQVMLWGAVERELPAMRALEVTSCIYAIGSLNVSHAHIGVEALDGLLRGLASQLHHCEEQELVMGLSGLHAMHVQWEQMPHDAQTVFLGNLGVVLERRPPVRLTSYLLRVLSAAGLKWAALDDDLRNSLRDCVLAYGDEADGELSLISSLGRMGTPWLHLGTAAQEALMGALGSVGRLGERDLAETLTGLAAMGLSWESLRAPVKESIQLAIRVNRDEMSEQGLAQVILSLARLEVCWSRDLAEGTKAALRSTICAQSSLGEHALSSVLYGLGKLGQVWSALHPEVRRTLKTAIVTSHEHQVWTAQGVANSLHGLAAMQASWNHLGGPVRRALTSEILKVAGLASETQLATILHSLAKLGLRWSSFSEELSGTLFAAVSSKLRLMNKQHLATLVFSLGSMSLQWHQLPRELQVGLAAALLRVESGQVCWSTLSTYLAGRADAHPAQGLSMILHGLGSLDARHHSLPKELSQALLRSFRACLPCMNAAQLGSALSGLAKMGWQAAELDAAEVSPGVHSAMLRMLPYSDPHDIAGMIAGINSLGVYWKHLPPELRRLAMAAVARVGREGRPEEVAGTCFALGSMECVWSLMPSRVREEVMAGIVRVCAEADVLSPHLAANLMYAVALLTFDARDSDVLRELNRVHLALLGALTSLRIGSFSERERSQVLIYLEYLRHLTQLGELPCRREVSCVGHEELRMSKLQLSVVQSLQSALNERSSGFELQNEYSAFGGTLPVDATILREGKVVAFIEVDGPHHYPCGVLRRKDVLKEMLYRHKHPGAVFARVRHDQVRRLGSNEIGHKVADFLCVVDPESEGWVNRRAERDLKRSLSRRHSYHSDSGHR